MKIYFLIVFFFFSLISLAQTDSIKKEIAHEKTAEDSLLEIENLRTSTGEIFRNYFVSRYSYPDDAIQDAISGTILIEFIVEIDGSVKEIKLTKKLCASCDAEAIRIIKKTIFKPKLADGKPIRARYIFPINLNLSF